MTDKTEMDIYTKTTKRVEQMRSIQEKCLELFKNHKDTYNKTYTTESINIIETFEKTLKNYLEITKMGINLKDGNITHVLEGLHIYSGMLVVDYFTGTEPKTVEESQIQKVQEDGLELFRRKNIDYGDAFAKYGTVGVLIRMEDKIQRALSIAKNGKSFVVDESLKDTLIDLNNYSAMALLLLAE